MSIKEELDLLLDLIMEHMDLEHDRKSWKNDEKLWKNYGKSKFFPFI